VQSSKKLTPRVVRIARKPRPDDADVGRVPTEDYQGSEHQPNSVKN